MQLKFNLIQNCIPSPKFSGSTPADSNMVLLLNRFNADNIKYRIKLICFYFIVLFVVIVVTLQAEIVAFH